MPVSISALADYVSGSRLVNDALHNQRECFVEEIRFRWPTAQTHQGADLDNGASSSTERIGKCVYI